MNFVKSNLAKKIIIILITLMIFNIAVPKTVNAMDLGGILFKPIAQLLLTVIVSIDTTIGIFLSSTSFALTGFGDIITTINAAIKEMDEDTVMNNTLWETNGETGEEVDGEEVDGEEIGETIGTVLVNGLDLHFSRIFIGPDTIFSGQIEMLDANIFKVDTALNIGDDSFNFGEVFQDSNLIGTIKVGIASTYVTLRNLAALIMLGGLIFSGIRILVSSNIPTQKQEWLRILQDWVIGMALLIFSHVIMVTIFWISDKLTEGLSRSLYGFGGLNFQLMWQCLVSMDFAEQIVSLAMFGYMTYLTVVFAVAYFKRLLWVCVLIVIAPITSTMYAFGRQGKSIYSRWLKEYTMTVLVQPYHIIIYYVLVSVPLNMVNSTGGGFSLADPASTLAAVYGLIAMSMIRPAEKWIRELCGMHQGVVSMASFDSGKQTLDAVAKAINDIAKKVVTTIVAIKTGGASKMIANGAGSAVTKNVGGALAKNAGKNKGLFDKMNGALGDGMGPGKGTDLDIASPKGNGLNKIPGQEGDPLQMGNKIPGQEGDPLQMGNKLQQDVDSANIQQQANGLDGNSQINASNVTVNAGKVDMQSTNMDDKEQQTITQRDASLIDENSSKTTDEEDQNRRQYNPEKFMNSIRDGRDISDEELAHEHGCESVEELLRGVGFSEEETSRYLNKDENVQRTTAENETERNTPEEFMNHFRGAGNTSDEELAKQYGCESVEEMLRDMGGFSEKEISEYLNKDESKDNGEPFELKEPPESFWEKFNRMKDIYSAAGADTELMGLGTEVYKGVNEVRDTFYVTSAPQDWKNTVGILEDRKKQKEEDKKKKTDQKEASFIKDEGNKQFMFDNLKIEGKSVMDYYRGVYAGKSEDYIAEKANDRVEQELEKMKGYAKYGMNAEQAYPIYQTQKQNGYTTEQAIVEYVSYQEFNNDDENIAYINAAYKNQIQIHNATNPPDKHLTYKPVTSVGEGLKAMHKDGIDNSKYYYAQGYKGARDMARVDFLQQKLNVTAEKAVELDRALRRTGTKLQDKGKRKDETDAQYRERVRTYFDINKAYEELRGKRGLNG